jgi:hypothetical protein
LNAFRFYKYTRDDDDDDDDDDVLCTIIIIIRCTVVGGVQEINVGSSRLLAS